MLATVSAPDNATSWLQSATPAAAGRVVLGDSTAKPAQWILDAVTIQEQSAATTPAGLLTTSILSVGSTLGAGLPTVAQASATPMPSAHAAGRTGPQTIVPAGETVTFSYDREGDRTGASSSDGTSQTYSYNQALELTGIGNSVTYVYHEDGLRMAKTVKGTTSLFTWDVTPEAPLLLEDGTNAYVYGPGGLPLEQITGSTALWFHHDQLGSTRLLTNGAGQTVATYAYTPHGSLASSSGTASTPLRYAGQYQDSESGFYYLRARYYDPGTGQFVTRDPSVSTTQSPYRYAENNPTNGEDPTGKGGPGQFISNRCTMVQYLALQGEVNLCNEITLFDGRYIQSTTACLLNFNEGDEWDCGVSYLGAVTEVAVPDISGAYLMLNVDNAALQNCTGNPFTWTFVNQPTITAPGPSAPSSQPPGDQQDDTTWEKIWQEQRQDATDDG